MGFECLVLEPKGGVQVDEHACAPEQEWHDAGQILGVDKPRGCRRDFLEFHHVVSLETTCPDRSVRGSRPRQKVFGSVHLDELERKGFPFLPVALDADPDVSLETGGWSPGLDGRPFVPTPVVDINKNLPNVLDGCFDVGDVFDLAVSHGRDVMRRDE